MIRVLALFTGLFIVSLANSQVNFEEKSNDILNNKVIKTTLSVSVSDINGDFYDDITVLDEGIYLKTVINTGNLKKYRIDSVGRTFNKPAWTINTGDFDNDGISEIYTCGAQTYGNYYRKVNGKYELSQELLGVSYAQNSNIADINNDGYLDLFVCNENNYNAIYINDGNGKLNWEDYINFKVDDNYNNYGDYGSDFIDFDDDGDIDLFITKCWGGAKETNDPRRVNTLFVNDGDDKYEDKAVDFGLNSGAQSWTGMFGDMDNDGDLDCFVTNHDTVHFLYENINNDTFINKTNLNFPAIKSSSIQASLVDFDNNGFLDIIIAADKSSIIWNKGNNEYKIENEPFGRGQIHSYGLGDFDNNGFIDVYASYGSGLNEVGNYKDLIWINKTNDNHFVKFSFWGEYSNRFGIGTKVKIYGEWGVQVRDVRIGESYGITNSHNLNFGLGNYNKIDSISVVWTSGIIDKYYDVKPDKHYLIQEGITISEFFDIEHEGELRFCTGDSVLLKGPDNYVTYEWSTGQTTKNIVARETNNYSLTVTDNFGEKRVSKIINTELNPQEKPIIEVAQGDIGNCIGNDVILKCPQAFEYYQWYWNGQPINDTSKELSVSTAGKYHLQTEGTCDYFYSDSIFIDFMEVEEPLVNYVDTITAKTEITFEAQGSDIYWYKNYYDEEPIFAGSTFITDSIESDTTFWVENHDKYQFSVKNVGLKNNIEKTDGASSVNGGLIFDCNEDIILKSIKVYAGEEGIRKFQLKNQNNDTLAYKEVMLQKGEQRVDLGFNISKGQDYKLETDKQVNLENLSTSSPNLYRDKNELVSFPYENDLISIRKSYFGYNYYYYFYDWEVQKKGFECKSDRIELKVVYDEDVSTNDFFISGIKIYPNPTAKFIFVDFPNGKLQKQSKVSIYNILGKKIVEETNLRGNKIDVSNILRGIYFLRIEIGHNSFVSKFIKN